MKVTNKKSISYTRAYVPTMFRTHKSTDKNEATLKTHNYIYSTSSSSSSSSPLCISASRAIVRRLYALTFFSRSLSGYGTEISRKKGMSVRSTQKLRGEKVNEYLEIIQWKRRVATRGGALLLRGTTVLEVSPDASLGKVVTTGDTMTQTVNLYQAIPKCGREATYDLSGLVSVWSVNEHL